MSHTPTPWNFVLDKRVSHEKYKVIYEPRTTLPSTVAEISEGPNSLADARLIASAPELLAVCISLANRVEELDGESKCSAVWMHAQALIKRVKGEVS